MNYKDAIHKTVHGYPGGSEALAPRLGMTVGVLRNKANPNSATNVMSIDDLHSLMTVSDNYTALYALAASLGHSCHKIEDGATNDQSVLESIAQVWQRSGEIGALVTKALDDGRVDAREVRDVREAVFKTIRSMMDLVERLNGMAEKG